MSTISNTVPTSCKGEPNCTQVDNCPAALNARENKLEAIAPYPYICLQCWLAGWRCDTGGEPYLLPPTQ